MNQYEIESTQYYSDLKEPFWEVSSPYFPEITSYGNSEKAAINSFCEKLTILWPVKNGIVSTH